MKTLWLIFFSTFASLAHATGESIYPLDIPLTDQSGQQLKLDVFRGYPVLISMFYASCPHVCPLTINTIQKTERALTESQRQNLRVLLVSLDPEKDTPALLTDVANRQKVDLSRWKLARIKPADVRKLAAVLDVRFRQQPDGEFNHSTLITLINAEGVPVARSDKSAQTDSNLIKQIAAETANKPK